MCVCVCRWDDLDVAGTLGSVCASVRWPRWTRCVRWLLSGRYARCSCVCVGVCSFANTCMCARKQGSGCCLVVRTARCVCGRPRRACARPPLMAPWDTMPPSPASRAVWMETSSCPVRVFVRVCVCVCVCVCVFLSCYLCLTVSSVCVCRVCRWNCEDVPNQWETIVTNFQALQT
jgi:hypothetical protein